MRRITRQPLDAEELEVLATLTARVRSAEVPKNEAKALWKKKPTATFEVIRGTLNRMAPGRNRCMYCEDSDGPDIEHFWPKHEYPERAFDWLNYLIACSRCNSNYKRTKFPLDEAGMPLLIDPTAEDPAEDPALHMQLLPSLGKFDPITPKGYETICIFGLNDETSPRNLPKGRRQTLIILKSLLVRYDDEIRTTPTQAAATREAILDHPFSSVLVWLLATARSPHAAVVLGADVVDIIERHQIPQWIESTGW